MKIILTGPNGNLGTQLKKLGAFDICSVGRNDWDKLELNSFDDFHGIIHSAYDLKNQLHQSPSSIIDSNIASTAKILEVARAKKIKKFYFISSCAVYGNSSSSFENQDCYPVSFNGYVKLINEKLVQNFCSQNGIEYYIFRVFNSYGGDDHFSVISRLHQAVTQKSSFTLFNAGISRRDFIHISDVAKIVSTLVHSKLNHNIINIGTGQTAQLSELVKIVSSRFIDLKIIHKTGNEAEYSRANTDLLFQYYKSEMMNVLDYVSTNHFNELS